MNPTQPTLLVFHNPVFRSLWIAALVSNFGGIVQLVGAAWLMTSLTSSESLVALVQTSVALPIMLFSLAAGVLADNFDRRRTMLCAQILMLATSLLLAVLAIFQVLTPMTLLAFTFVIGCGTALHNPSWQASVGDIVTREHLRAAVSANAMGFNMVRSVGPAIGGTVVAIGGAAAAFALNAVSYLALIAALWRWRPAPAARNLPREPFGAAFSAGLRYVAMSPNLIRVILRSILFGFAAIAAQALLPVIVRDQLEAGAMIYGILLGFFGLGAVLGGLASGWLREHLTNERVVQISFLAHGLATIVIATGNSTTLSALALLLAGASWLVALTLFNSSMQMATPRWVVGRALALYQTGIFGGMAVGSWAWGQIAEAQSTVVALLVSAAALFIGALLGRLVALPEVDNLNLDPLDRFTEPHVPLDLSNRSGPIMIMVEYSISESDVPDFLGLMAERRRIRVRDGAKRWTLLRDLQQPEVWTEAYHVPTWIEYVRHHSRRTQDDAIVSERLASLHIGTSPPMVRRMIERQAVPKRDDTPRFDETRTRPDKETP